MRIDPSGLPPGMHSAEVLGYDADDVSAGPLFRIPVAVMQSHSLAGLSPPVFKPASTLALGPGTICREFVEAPVGATWAEVRVKVLDFGATGTAGAGNAARTRMIYLHCLHLLPHTPFSVTQCKKVFHATAAQTYSYKFAVVGGRTLELTLAQFWSSLGDCDVELQCEFHGGAPSDSAVRLTGAERIVQVNVSTALGAEKLSPSASLTVRRRFLRPKASAACRPLGERDCLPGAGEAVLATAAAGGGEGEGTAAAVEPNAVKTYELVLEYTLKLDDAASVTPRALMLQNHLYEAALESQLIQIFDKEKRIVGTTDAWPEAVKLGKGEFTLQLQLRHRDVALLERFRDMPLGVDTPLAKSVSLSCHASYDAAVTGGGSFGTRLAQPGALTPVFFSLGADADKDAKAAPGDVLLGPVKYSLEGPGENAVQSKHSGARWLACYTVPPAANSATAVKPAATDKAALEAAEPSAEQKLADAVLALQIEHLAKLRGAKTAAAHAAMAAAVRAQAQAQPPTAGAATAAHLPLSLEMLARAVADAEAAKAAEADTANKPEAEEGGGGAAPASPPAAVGEMDALRKQVEWADELARAVDAGALAAHYGLRKGADAEAAALRTQMDSTKAALTTALTRKAEAQARLAFLRATAGSVEGSGATAEQLESQLEEARADLRATLAELAKWQDLEDASGGDGKWARLAAHTERALGRPGSALKSLVAHIAAQVA